MLTFDGQLFTVALDGALRSMPSAWAESYILTDLRGVRQEEAAALLGRDQATVSRQAARARAAIREELLSA